MKLSRAAMRPLLAAHERGALVRAAWGVIARKASHNASNARGDAAGNMGCNSSINNCLCSADNRLHSGVCLSPSVNSSHRQVFSKNILWHLSTSSENVP